jgi:hypothetical protein
MNTYIKYIELPQSYGSGMFYPGYEHFFILDPDPNIFHPGTYMKRRMKSKNYIFSCFRSKS